MKRFCIVTAAFVVVFLMIFAGGLEFADARAAAHRARLAESLTFSNIWVYGPDHTDIDENEIVRTHVIREFTEKGIRTGIKGRPDIWVTARSQDWGVQLDATTGDHIFAISSGSNPQRSSDNELFSVAARDLAGKLVQREYNRVKQNQ